MPPDPAERVVPAMAGAASGGSCASDEHAHDLAAPRDLQVFLNRLAPHVAARALLGSTRLRVLTPQRDGSRLQVEPVRIISIILDNAAHFNQNWR